MKFNRHLWRDLGLPALLLLFLILIYGECLAEEKDYIENIPSHLPHPRLLIHGKDLKQISPNKSDSLAIAKVNKEIIDYSNRLLNQATLERKMQGIRLLDVSREALKRVFYLSYAYRFTGQEEYADRAIKELVAVCSFSDWNPAHFLDVGEMSMAVGIGYDWLHDKLKPEEKNIIVEALKEKAFIPSFQNKYNRFKRLDNNWNSVCNAGLLYAAIAVAEELPELSKQVINEAIRTNYKAIEKYGPDGGYPEGYMYWDYGTTFQLMLIDALIQCFDTDYGLLDNSGFRNSGRFIQYMIAPSGIPFNFSDCTAGASANIPLWWYAAINNDPSLTFLFESSKRKEGLRIPVRSRVSPLIPILSSRLNTDSLVMPRGNFWFSKGETPVFIYRSGWNSKSDSYLGIKGGSPKTPHAHMDGGSFVYEYGGKRWASDLGMPVYHDLEKQGVKLWDGSQNGQRWEIMKMRNDCHNTLTIDTLRHKINGRAEFLYTFTQDDHKGAVIDLTSLLDKVSKAHREVSLDSNNFLSVTDTVRTEDSPITVTWTMVTPAAATIECSSILLQQDDIAMKLSMSSSIKYQPMIWSNDPIHSYDQTNPGTIRVGFRTRIKPHTEEVLKVKLEPNKSQIRR